MQPLSVTLGDRSYPIHIGAGLLNDEKLYAPYVASRNVAVVTNRIVAALYLERVQRGIERAGGRVVPILIEDGEQAKAWATLDHVIDAMLAARCGRDSIVVALGGGVVGDLAGFAAAVYQRGVPFIQVPTTLLAQVDSAVGGKTAVDARHGKNLIGAFHQPRLVLADLDALATLPARERRAGYAEIVKYGLIDDPGFFGWCEANAAALLAGDAVALGHAVAFSCRAKARVVGADEREADARMLLNLGHTFAHAFETALGFDAALLHGEAVAIGMAMAFDLSTALGFCPPGDAVRVRRHLAACGLPTESPRNAAGPERLVELMAQDKKARGGLTFVLARGIGRAFVAHDVPPDAVRSLLARAFAA